MAIIAFFESMVYNETNYSWLGFERDSSGIKLKVGILWIV